MRWRASRCRCTATGKTCATGCLWRITARRSAQCSSGPTRRDVQHRREQRAGEYRCGDGDLRPGGRDAAGTRRRTKARTYYLRSRTGRGTTAGMRLMQERSRASWAGSPAEAFESGLRKTVRWYLEHGEWVESVRTGAYRDWIEKNYAERGALRAVTRSLSPAPPPRRTRDPGAPRIHNGLT
jgi:hypothetical protein